MVAASHLSELIDQLVPVMEPDGLLETQYRMFSNLRRREFTPDDSEDWTEEYIFMWETAEKMMALYERAPVMTDLELELESESLFALGWNIEIDKEDTIRSIFGYVLAYIEGMKDAELRDRVPRLLRQLTFHGPGFDLESYFMYQRSWHESQEQLLESLEFFRIR